MWEIVIPFGLVCFLRKNPDIWICSDHEMFGKTIPTKSVAPGNQQFHFVCTLNMLYIKNVLHN